MRKDQKGFSLIELLIAVVIMSVVMAAVCGFIIVGSKSYAAANSDITVQSEAQLSLNQMSDVLIDTTRSVNYAGYDASGSTTQLVIKDSEFTFEPMGKSLTMYNGVVTKTETPGGGTSTSVETGNGNKHYQFYWDKSDETLYYTELAVQSADVKLEDIHFPAFGDPAWVVLAEHVTDFSVDLSQVEEKRVVQLAMTFVNGTKEYNTSNNITIRNKVGVNDVELEALDRKKTLSVSCKDVGVILEPGETYHFSVPIVSGKNVMDKSVTWSMDPAYGGSSCFTDTTNGILQIANDEPAGELRVVITTNAVDSDGNHATLTVPVMIKRVTDIAMSKINDEVAENGPTEVTAGKKFSIQAAVNGVKLGVACNGGCKDDITKDKDVINWQVEGPATRVDTNGDVLKTEYKVNDNAKEGDIITIRATSLLSTKRPYPDVVGVIKLTVKKGKGGEMTLDGVIRWGKKVGFSGKYPDDFNKGGQGYYLIFARIKEDLGAPASEDKIMVYTSHGNNSALTPDLFGVQDISKPWYVSLQVLDPGQHFQSGVGPSEQLLTDLKNQINDRRVLDVIDDYLANCDSSGTYIGSKYPSTEKMTGIIQPPEIYYAYNGMRNLSGQLNLEPVSILRGGPWDTQFSVDYVKNTRGEVDGGDYNARYVKFKVYKEGSDGSWGDPFFYYVQEDRHSHDLSAGGSWHGRQDDGHINFDITSATNAYIKVNYNNNPMEAVGKYHIVPIIKYVHDPGADSSYSVYYANYQPNYWNVQTYDVPESTINFELTRGANIVFKDIYAQSGYFGAEGYFTIPSDTGWNGFSSLFELENTDWHYAKLPAWGYSIDLYKPDNSKTSLSVAEIRCRYIRTEKSYEIEIFYGAGDWGWDADVGKSYQSLYSTGVYKCKEDGTKWEQVSVGRYVGKKYQ